jgi:dihydroorotate dehydrogenase electron transfer subunit
MVKAGPLVDSILRRPFSVFEVVREHGRVSAISILNKRAGRNTRELYAVQPGARVACLGPLGKPFSVDAARATGAHAHGGALMVAGGVGLAPFATLAESLAAARIPTTLFYGARSGRELFCRDFFSRLGVRLVLATEDGSEGQRGRVTVPLEQELAALSGPNAAMVYTCGPEPMLEAVAKLAARYRQPCEVSVERVMGCGLGGCYSCVLPVRQNGGAHFVRSCIGGPVFNAADVAWEKC